MVLPYQESSFPLRNSVVYCTTSLQHPVPQAGSHLTTILVVYWLIPVTFNVFHSSCFIPTINPIPLTFQVPPLSLFND